MEWRQRYPQLFDEDDERVLTTVHQRQYHFFEWLSAVLLFEATGYQSLIIKYTAKSHPQKRSKLRAILPAALDAWLCANESGQPDLFVYNPNTGDWYFCEVKGGKDRIRSNMIKWMKDFAEELQRGGISNNKRIHVLCLKEIS